MSRTGFVVSSTLYFICETAAFQPLPLSSFPPASTPSAVVASTEPLSSSSLDDWVEHYFIQEPVSQSSMRHAVLPFSVECYDESVVFVQRATSTRIRGIEQIQRACELWDRDFINDLAGSVREDEERRTAISPITIIERISRTSPTTLVVQWNTSYVPPTSQWLPNVARLWGWQLDPLPYNDQSGSIKTSYQTIVKLFMDAIATKKLRVPLACIKGTTVCECTSSSSKTIVSITEDLAYAQDLQRGVLQNRVCGQDLQSFLETARRPPGTNPEAWQEHMSNNMPWSTVPGLTDPLSIEAMNEEEAQWIPALFLGAVSLFVLGFAYVLAPELIGQSLFGPRSYIVPPQDLNDIISY